MKPLTSRELTRLLLSHQHKFPDDSIPYPERDNTFDGEFGVYHIVYNRSQAKSNMKYCVCLMCYPNNYIYDDNGCLVTDRYIEI